MCFAVYQASEHRCLHTSVNMRQGKVLSLGAVFSRRIPALSGAGCTQNTSRTHSLLYMIDFSGAGQGVNKEGQSLLPRTAWRQQQGGPITAPKNSMASTTRRANHCSHELHSVNASTSVILSSPAPRRHGARGPGVLGRLGSA